MPGPLAVLGTYGLRAAGLDLSASVHAASRLELGSLVLGGITFGIGMALAGNCAFGTLLRLGGGDLKALIVTLVVAVSAGAASGMLRNSATFSRWLNRISGVVFIGLALRLAFAERR